MSASWAGTSMYGYNKRVLVSDEEGIRLALLRMLENLREAGVMEDGYEVDRSLGLHAAYEAVHERLADDEPFYFEALSPELAASGGSQPASLDLREFAPGVCGLWIWYNARHGGTGEGFGNIMDPGHVYFARKCDGTFDCYDYRCEGDDERRVDYDDEDLLYGIHDMEACFARTVAGVEPPLCLALVEGLARNDDADGLEALADKDGFTGLCSQVKLRDLFDAGHHRGFGAVLRHVPSRIRLRKPEAYLETMCEEGLHDLVPLFVERYAWSKKTGERAIEHLSAKDGCEEAAECIRARLASDELRPKEEQVLERAREGLRDGSSGGRLCLLERDWGRGSGEIPDGCFEGTDELTSALVDSWKIGERAFAGCANLESVRFPTTSLHIGSSAFAGCTSLGSFVAERYEQFDMPFPEIVTVDLEGDGVFDGCTALESLALPTGYRSRLRRRALGSLPNLRTLRVTGKCVIEPGALEGCAALERLELGKDVTLEESALEELPEGAEVVRLDVVR